MLVLVATNELQGANGDDYSYTVEGELVTPLAGECPSGERCGCNRGFPGLASGFATTTAMVAERPGVTEEDLRDAVFDWLDRCGWIDLIESIIDEHVDCIHQVCSTYPVGTIVGRLGTLVMSRSYPTAA